MTKDQPTVAVVGLGYIGLPTAAIIARSGCQVIGVDTSQDVVETINRGGVHIEEVDLDGLVQAVVAGGTLRASTQMPEADVYVVAVPTPFVDEVDHEPDTGYVMAAVDAIAPVLRADSLVICESTCPVGTTLAIRDRLSQLRPDLAMPGLAKGAPDIAIAYCPERVLPGRILEELVHNDRSVGGITPRCARKAQAFYKRFVRGECVATDARSAEMTKLVENAFRDVNIAFANELSMIADKQGLDVWEVIGLANRHPRVNILQPGPGVGGHCIAVDPWFIVHSAPEEARVIRTAREVNNAKTQHVLERTSDLIAANPGVPVACLGLAFKPNIDDFRESPARFIAARLAHKFGQRICVVEPFADQLPAEFDDTGAQLIDIDTALESCGILILLVDHDLFRTIPAEEREGAIVYDTRGIWGNQLADSSRAALRLAS